MKPTNDVYPQDSTHRARYTLPYVGVRFGAVLLLAGCFYDSRWGESKRAQERSMQHAMPATIESAARVDGAPREMRTLRVKVWMTPSHRAQVVDAERRAQDALDDASKAYAGVGARFTVVEFKEWPMSDESLEVALAELEREDPGQQADLVVGLLGALPKLSADFSKLGLARPLGRHLVARAPLRPGEFDEIEQSYDELSVKDREELRAKRKRHRAATILIHELGHALGALHDNANVSFMNPSYSGERASFGPENTALLQVGVRFAVSRAGDAKDFAKEMLAALNALPTETSLLPHERSEARARIERGLVKPAPAPSTSAAPSTTSAAGDALPEDVRALAESDRDQYQQIKALLAQQKVDAARVRLAPLVSAHPKVFSIQDLRCQVASARNLSLRETRAECEHALKLLRPGAAQTP